MSLLLDTHVWVWWLTPGSPLAGAERDAVDAGAERRELFLAAITLREAQMLHAKLRLELPLPFAQWLRQAADERRSGRPPDRRRRACSSAAAGDAGCQDSPQPPGVPLEALICT
ncbi:MAG: type II toxin-antitoxin system VapC family toxin [Terriglobales bacterium]